MGCNQLPTAQPNQKKDKYPLPRINNTLDRLGGAKFFSAMDLLSGYWQVEIATEDQEKCAMITSKGFYQPTQMAQGLANAPETFQRLMDNTFADLKLSCVLIYLGDINIYDCTFEDHLEHLKSVFARLCNKGLKLKPSKCSFFKDQIEFLGHVLTPKGISPIPVKTKVISAMTAPTDLRGVQVILGMAGYYQRFIPRFAEVAQPLFFLLKSNIDFKWTNECKEAFQLLKDTLISQPFLAYHNFDKPFVLHTDASSVAIGAVILQTNDVNEEHPISYMLQTLNKHERNYSTTERE